MEAVIETPAVEPIEQPTPAPAPTVDYAQHESAIREYLQTKGLVVKPAAEVQKEIDSAVGNTHKAWEGKVAEVLGQPKPDGMKGLDWVATALKKPEPQPEPAPAKVADEVAAAQIKSLQEQLNQFKVAAEAAEQSAQSRKLTLNLESEIKGVFNSKDADFEGKAEAIRAAIKAKYEQKLDELDNTVLFKDGEAQINPATQKPYTVSEVIKKDFAWMMPKEKAPVEGTRKQPSDIPSVDSEGRPFMVATKEEDITRRASELGLVYGSPERNDFVTRSLAASGLK